MNPANESFTHSMWPPNDTLSSISNLGIVTAYSQRATKKYPLSFSKSKWRDPQGRITLIVLHHALTKSSQQVRRRTTPLPRTVSLNLDAQTVDLLAAFIDGSTFTFVLECTVLAVTTAIVRLIDFRRRRIECARQIPLVHHDARSCTLYPLPSLSLTSTSYSNTVYCNSLLSSSYGSSHLFLTDVYEEVKVCFAV
jgi:hypothetical protein